MSENKLVIEFDNDETEETLHSEEKHRSHRHHSSSGHSSRKRRKRNAKKEKTKRFFKKNKFLLVNLAVAVIFLIVLIILSVNLDKYRASDSDKNDVNSAISVETDSVINIGIPFFDEDIVISGTAIETFMSPENTSTATSIYKKYAGAGRLDTGLPVKITYSVGPLPDGCSVETAKVYVSENSNFSSSSVYPVEKNETSVEIYHLKVNTKYYYKITLLLSNGSEASVESSFKTAFTPRVLSVDGVANLRDIGGWTTLDGKRIKQGLLYRSAEIDGAVNSKYSITPDGVNTMLSVFGIRTDMDLRHKSDNPNGTDALGAGVEHIYYGAPMYAEAFTDNGKAKIKNIFSDLADKNNYPVLLHCTHGMDRTGTVCYLLEAILGVNEDDLMKEYQLSAFYHGSLWGESDMNEFIGQLKSYPGTTINQKAENYLLSAGVTPEQISSIREIFLEDNV